MFENESSNMSIMPEDESSDMYTPEDESSNMSMMPEDESSNMCVAEDESLSDMYTPEDESMNMCVDERGEFGDEEPQLIQECSLNYATLAVTVVDACQHQPLDGIRVTVSGPEDRTATTGGPGRVIFERITAGDYSVEADPCEVETSCPSNYQPVTTTVTVAAGTSQQIQLEVFIDELTPIALYIANEMNVNAVSSDVQKIQEFNSFSYTTCIQNYIELEWWQQLLGLGITPEQCADMQMSYRMAALMAWASKVHQDGEWDHKPKISKRFHPRVPNGQQHWHLYGRTLYYYDVWSNIHYGYVGRACGFSDADLLDGAGLEQIGSTLLRFNWPEKSPDVSGLRAYDDPSDRAGIMIGIKLYSPSQPVSAHSVLQEVLKSTQITKKPCNP